jgi:Cd2+/Zn2+-exporting ATPase
MESLHYTISGMDCADCATGIEKAIKRLDGVAECTVNFSTAKLDVVHDPTKTPGEKIVARVKALGYEAHAPQEEKSAIKSLQRNILFSFASYLLSRWQTACAVAGGILLGLGLAIKFFAVYLPPSLVDAGEVLLVFALLLAGFPIARSGFARLWINREININLLMTVAAAGALIIGETSEAATVIFLFAIGEALEGFTMERSRRSIRSLMELAPNHATVLRPCLDCKEHIGRNGYVSGPCPYCGAHEKTVRVEDLQIGETILVKPGERLPMDGVVISGESGVNQAPITGESISVAKSPGAEVFAGSVNGEGSLEVRVTKHAEDLTLARIIQLVEQAQAKRAPVQRFFDRFAAIYTPVVVAAAVLVAVVPPLFFHQPFWNLADGAHGWLYRALTLLVISCPCALVISTPVSIVSAISAAARHGVLIKGGAYLEVLARVRAFAFDKTGTLTYGRPTVVSTRSVDCENPNGVCKPCGDMLALAAAVERRSEHPLAKAVVDAAGEQARHGDFAVGDVESLAGRGVRGTVNGKRVTVGNHKLFDAEFPHDESLCRAVKDAEANGQTAMMVSDGDKVRGYIAVADQLRDAGHAAIEDLKNLGIQKTVMLTGDNPTIASAIAEGVGVDEVRANLLPADKQEVINSLRDEYEYVAMVGDGINDAPALASASVGIAMGAASAQALEAADVALMSNDLTKVPAIIRHSRETMSVIKQNVVFSIAIKVIFLALALPGLATLWMAVFADTGASLLVTLNGMRLLWMAKAAHKDTINTRA